jgi:hypothetical protein
VCAISVRCYSAARSESAQWCAGVRCSACERAVSYYSREYRVKKIIAGWRGVSQKGRILLANPNQ